MPQPLSLEKSERGIRSYGFVLARSHSSHGRAGEVNGACGEGNVSNSVEVVPF